MVKRGRKRLFTDEQLIELHEQGLNDTEKGEKLGADSSTVNRHRNRLRLEPIRKYGINALGANRQFTDEELIKLHERGYSDRLMGKKLGATRQTVGVHRLRLGLDAHNQKRQFTDQELIELHKQGFDDYEIAKKLGANKGQVRYHRIKLRLKVHGLDDYSRMSS